jgi:preprotein translocase subunit SecE
MAIVRTTTTGNQMPDPKKPTSGKDLNRPGGRGLTQQRGSVPNQAANRGQFINDVRAEMRRVVWPTRDEVRSGVIVTVLLLLFFAFYIFGLDWVTERLLGAVFTTKSS